MGRIYLIQRQHEKAITEGKRYIALNPNSAFDHAHLGNVMFFSGRFDEAITLIKKAMRLNPKLPPTFLINLNESYIFLGRYEEGLPPLGFSWVCQEFSRDEEARAYMEKALKIKPSLLLEFVKLASPYKNPAHLQRQLDALRKAGLPEKAPRAVP